MSNMSLESELWFLHSLNGSDEKVYRGSITVRKTYLITFRGPIDRFEHSQDTVVASNSHKEAILPELNDPYGIIPAL
jgi:hypothetical protein